jgi:hypothetical protein
MSVSAAHAASRYPETVRLVIIAAALLTGCGAPPAPTPPHDVTTDAGYGQTVEQLAGMTREAENFFQHGKPDDAAALIEKGEPLASQVLSVARPTLAAMEAASDLDNLYGRMLMSNRHYAWARMLFQKNLARWKYWTPQTEETDRLLKQAESAIAECDKRMTE